MTAPHRKKKHDRLTYRGASAADIECDFALGPLDRIAVEMDRKWGVDRLPELMPPDVARKYGAAMAHLDACIAESKPAETAAAADNCIRGLRRMDEIAEAAGHQPLTPDVWEFEMDGQVIGIIRETGDWRAAEAMRPGVKLYTMRQVANALAYRDAWPDRIAKDAAAPRPKTELEKSLNDEIPW